MKKIIKFIFRSLSTDQNYQLIFLTKQAQFQQAQLIIRIFYVIIFLFEYRKYSRWTSLVNTTSLDPIWPVYWLNYVNIEFGILCILYLGLCSSLLAITFPNWRITRILVFLSLLEFTAFNNSFGKINHAAHLSILLSFILIFLPSRWDSLKKVNQYTKNTTLMIFASCQSFIMLTYTMAGIGKVFGAVIQGFQGEIHNFAPQALALHIARAFSQQDSYTVLGLWLMEHYYIGWPLMIGTIYLQFFAIWAVFRPSLHQIWGFGLILFHIASVFTMKISFMQSSLWLVLFFINSPFRPLNFNIQQVVEDLPIFGFFFRLRLKYSEQK